MLQGWLARMCRFTYGLLTEDGLSNILLRNVCLVYMMSMSKETLWLCVLGTFQPSSKIGRKSAEADIDSFD